MGKFPTPPIIPNLPIIRYSRVNGLKVLKLQPIQLLDSAVSSSTSDHKPDTIWLHREQLPAPNPLSFPSSKSNETQTIANFWQQILMLHFVLILWSKPADMWVAVLIFFSKCHWKIPVIEFFFRKVACCNFTNNRVNRRFSSMNFEKLLWTLSGECFCSF